MRASQCLSCQTEFDLADRKVRKAELTPQEVIGDAIGRLVALLDQRKEWAT